MGRKKRNTIQRSMWMHPKVVKEVRAYARKRTDEEIKKEESQQPKTE